jgi:hypothetical protein
MNNVTVFEEDKVICALAEFLCWWDHSDAAYNKWFAILKDPNLDRTLRNFIFKHHFKSFLRAYSVARTLPRINPGNGASGNVENIFNKLVDSNFIQKVLEGDTSIIMEYSNQLQDEESTRNGTISFLSKFASLINPSGFVKYDNLARNSLHKLLKTIGKPRTHDSLCNYNGYNKGIKDLEMKWNEEDVDQIIKKYLARFRSSGKSEVIKKVYFSPNSYRRRILDKYLWYEGIEAKPDIRSASAFINNLATS